MTFRRYQYGRWDYQTQTETRSGFVDIDPPEISYYLNGGSARAFVTDPDDAEMTIEWETFRHWLGDSLFTARVRGSDRRFRFVSSFDYQEPWPLYFLAALPHRSRAVTVADAIEDLAPSIVHAAYAREIPVMRQGDIFAIETALTDSDIAAMATDRTRLTVWTRNAKPRKGETGYRDTVPSMRRMKTETRARRAAMRKSLRDNMDIATDAERNRIHRAGVAYRNEVRALRATVARLIDRGDANRTMADGTSFESSYLTSARDRLRAVQSAGRPVFRDRGYNARETSGRLRGRCYCRALSRWQILYDQSTARLFPPIDRDRIRRTLTIHGTAHTATEIAVTARGVTYARGKLIHRPDLLPRGNRNADHRTVTLGDGQSWHLVIRNTVPRL